MRRLFIVAALAACPILLWAQAQSTTPNIGLYIPGYNSSSWQVPLDYNFGLLDRLISVNVALLPPATSNPNLFLWVGDGASATDCTVGGGTYAVACKSNGTTWVALSVGSGGGGGLPTCGTGSLLGYPSSIPLGGCISLGTNLSLTSGGVLNATGSGGISAVNGTSGQITSSTTSGTVSLGLPATITQGETFSGTTTFTGPVVSSGATRTAPVVVVTSAGSLPATCTAGDLGFVTSATAGQQIYECSATNTWTQQLNSGGGSNPLISLACTGSDNAPAINALTTAYSPSLYGVVTIVLPTGTTCPINSPIQLYSGEFLTSLGTGGALVAMSTFSGSALVNLESTSGYFQGGGIIGIKFDDSAVSGGLIAVQSVAGNVTDAYFAQITLKTVNGLFLNTYSQDITINNLHSFGPVKTVLELYGNFNHVFDLDAESVSASDSSCYVQIGNTGTSSTSDQNTLDHVLIEGTGNASKPLFCETNANNTVVTDLWMEPNTYPPYPVILTSTIHSRFYGRLAYLNSTAQVQLNTSYDVWFDKPDTSPQAIQLYSVVAADSTSTYSFGRAYSRSISDDFPFSALSAGSAISNGTGQYSLVVNQPGYLANVQQRDSSGENLFVNGSFEAGVYGWTWNTTSFLTQQYVQSNVDQGLMGEFTTSNTGEQLYYLYQSITVPAAWVGIPMTLSGKFKVVDSASHAATGIQAYLSGAGITDSGYGSSATINNTGWGLISQSFTPLASGTLNVGFRLVLYSTATIYADDLVLAFGTQGTNYSNKFQSLELAGNLQTYASAAPTTGTWTVGAFVWNTVPTTILGWVCTTAGSPGTWTAISTTSGSNNYTAPGTGSVAVPISSQTTGTMILGADYGMVCDGSHASADTAGLGYAIGAVNSVTTYGPIVVQLPAGTCQLNATVATTTSNFVLQGAPGGTIIQAAMNAWLTNMITFTGSYITVRGIKFDGNIGNYGMAWGLQSYNSASTYNAFGTAVSGTCTSPTGVSGGPDVVENTTGGTTTLYAAKCNGITGAGEAPPNLTYWSVVTSTTQANVVANPTGTTTYPNSNIYSVMLLFYTATSHIHVYDVELTGGAQGVYVDATTGNINDIQVDHMNCHDFGARYQGNNASFKNGLTCLIVSAGSSNYAIDDTTVTNSTFTNIFLPGSAGWTTTNNTGPGYTAAAILRGNNVRFADNKIENVIQGGGGTMSITGSLSGTCAINQTVTGNTLQRTVGIINGDISYGFEIEGTGFAYTGNTVTGYAIGGQIHPCTIGGTNTTSEGIISGNVFVGPGTGVSGSTGFELAGTSGSAGNENITISGNTISNYACGIFLDSATLDAPLVLGVNQINPVGSSGARCGLPTTATTNEVNALTVTSGSTTSGIGDFPQVITLPAATCEAGTAATSVWSSAGTGFGGFSPHCRGGTYNIQGSLQAVPSTGAVAQFLVDIPADYDMSTQPYIRILYGSGANTSGTVIWTIAEACLDTNGSITDDPSFNTEGSAFATQTMAAANRTWTSSGQLTYVGGYCYAGGAVLINVTLSGTASSAINVYDATITMPRHLVNQAN